LHPYQNPNWQNRLCCHYDVQVAAHDSGKPQVSRQRPL